jgi:hypothetical protein
MMVQRIAKLLAGGVPLLAIGISLLLAGCGARGNDKVVIVPPSAGSGAVALRVPDPSLYRKLEVQTWMGRYPVMNDGSFQAEFPDLNQDVRFAFVSLKDRPHDALYYAYYFPPQYETPRLKRFIYRPGNLLVDGESTALTMILLNPLLFHSTVEQRALIADRALAHPLFRELVNKIEDLRTLSPETPIRYETTPDLFFLSSRILIETMKQIAEELPDEAPAPTYTPQGISYDYDMAYPQNTNIAFKFVNPKMAHYVAGAVVVGDSTNTFQAETYIPGKERWLRIDIGIFPPRLNVQVVPPVEVDPEGMNEGAYIVHIYKGFQFDLPFQTLWNTPPARKAMVANIYAAWAMMIALAGDITEILVNVFYGGVGAKQLGGFIRFLDQRLFQYNNQVPVQNLWNVVQTRDRVQTINSMYHVFVAVLPAIKQTLEDRARQLYGDAAGSNGVLNQIGTIFSAVWSLVSGGGIVNAIIDITTQIIPFYYDLFTAHGYAAYPVFNMRIQELPNNPTISKVYPVTVFNGKNASAVGFGFGSTPGRIFVTGSKNGGNPYQLDTILSWSPAQILFKMPDDEQGKSVAGSTVIYLQITTSDSKTTNTYMASYRYVPPGQDQGGGGCTLNPARSCDNTCHPLGFILISVAILLVYRSLRERRKLS